MRRFSALCVLCLFGGGLIWSQTHEYQVLMDLDYDAATGCTIATESGPVGGVDAVLYTQVDVSTHLVTRTEWASCSGGVVGPRQLLNNGGYFLGQGLGLGAGDVLETYLPIQPLSTAGTIQVAFRVINLVDSQEDSLILTDAGGPLEIFVYVPIPTLKFWLLLLMGGLLLGLGLWFIRRQKQIPPWATSLLVLIAAMLTFGFSFVITLDGDPSDWNGISPLALDPAGDVTNPDLLAVFGTACPNELYFRFDALLNTPPTVDNQAVNLLEDGSLLITLTGSDADGDNISFATSTPPSHGSLSGLTQIPPNSATVTYQPDPDYFGADSFQFTASDGANSSLAGTISLTVDPVNDAPSFVSGGNVSVFKEQGPYDAPWASNLSAGPLETQNLTFAITANDNPSLFSVQPSISPLGNLQFTGATDQVGTANLMVVLMDDGGTANGGIDQSAPVAFSISFQGVNDPPSFTAGSDQNAFEDAGPQTVAGWATNLNDGDGGGQTLTFMVTGNTNPSLFSAGPNVDGASGDLTFTSSADAVGSATITLVLMDNGGTANGGSDTSAPASFSITIDPVNDAPSFVVGSDPTVLEDSGPQTFAGWATSLSAGPADESGQVLSFMLTGNTNPGLFSAGPSVDGTSGDLTFTPAADAVGSATISLVLMDDGGTANGGVDTSGTAMFTIQVDPVNDPPSFTSGGDVMFTGANVPQTIAGWATNLSPGPADESSQVLTFVITGNDNSSLFAVAPAVNGSNGDLTFTPAMGASGSANITLHLEDDGGTANGGSDFSAPVMFNLMVTAQNQEPSFTVGSDPTVLEDSGSQSVIGWATNISDGDGGTQVLTFNITGNTNPGLFSVAPAVDATTGTLTFTPAADAFGSATITLELMDDGGTAGGGDDTSPAAMFTINVTAVNDAPSFTAGMDPTVLEDAGAQSIMGWATAISAGPANEVGQMLTFNVTGNTNPSLFSSAPTVNASGDLSFTSVMDGSGSATLTLVLMDDGGTANGGFDTSAAVMFTITITPVNDPPTAADDSGYATYPHVSIVVERTPPSYAHLVSTQMNVLNNDSDPDSLSFSVVTLVGSGDTTEPFIGATTLGGEVEMYADGSFIYHPPAGTSNTTDTFQYTLEDDLGAQSDATVSINIANQEPIWFIDDTAAAGGTGTSYLPFNNVSDFLSSAQNDNDIIFIYAGNTATTAIDGQFFLSPGQILQGEGTALQVVHPENMMTTTLVGAGTRPVLVSSLGDIVTLDSDNQVLGLDLRPTLDAGILSGIVPMKTETALSQLSDPSPVNPPDALEKGITKTGAVVLENLLIQPSASATALLLGSETDTFTITNCEFRGMAGNMSDGVAIVGGDAVITFNNCQWSQLARAIWLVDLGAQIDLINCQVNQNQAGFDNQVLVMEGGDGGSVTLSGTTSITVNNLGAGSNAIDIDGLGGDFNLLSDLSSAIALTGASGQTAFSLVGSGSNSVIGLNGPIDILSAGNNGLILSALSGMVTFQDIDIAGVTNTSLQIADSDADFFMGMGSINSSSGRSLLVSNNTGSLLMTGGAIIESDLGVLISNNTWSGISTISNPLTISSANGTGLSLTNNFPTIAFQLSGTVTVNNVDQRAMFIDNNNNLILLTASLAVTDGGGGGAEVLQISNTSGDFNFSSISGVNTAGKGIDLFSNPMASVIIHDFNLLTTGGIGLDVSNTGSLTLNDLGGSATINTTNELGLDIDNTALTFASISSIQVTGNGGGIRLNNTVGLLTLEDLSLNVSGGPALVATNAELNVDPLNINSATISAMGQPAIQLNGAMTSAFNLASTASSMSSTGVTATGVTGIFNFGDTTITSTGNGVDLSASPFGQFVFDDLDVTSTAGSALVSSGLQSVTVDANDDDSPTLTATTRPVLDIDNCRINMNLASLTSTSSNTHGVDLTNIASGSTLTMSGTTTLTSPTSFGVNIDDVESGSSLVFGNCSITNRGSHGIFIQDHNGALIGFGDVDITNGLNVGGDGVHVQTSGGATSSGTISFASLDISATNATVNRVDGDTNGLPDNETYDGNAVKLIDHTGSFTVTAMGSQGNGGTIQNIEGDGFSLIRSGGLDLVDMVINNIGTGNQSAASVDNAGIFAFNLIGSNSLQDCTISRFQDGGSAGGSACGIFVINSNTSFTNLHVTDTTFFNDNSLLGDDGIQIITQNTVSGALIVDSAFNLGNINNTSEFYQISGTGIQVIQNGGGTLTCSITDTTFRDTITPGGFGGIDIASAGSGILSSNIDECLFLDLYPGGVNNSGVISLFAGGTADNDATINNCTFGSATQRTSDGRGAIRASTDTDLAAVVTDFDITITNNTIDDTDREAISILPRGGAVPLASGQSIDVIITGNDIGQTTPVANDSGLGREGIEVVSSENAKLINLLVQNNTVTNFVDSSSDESLDIKAFDSTSINAIILGNTFNQSGAAGTADSIDVSTQSAGASICLDLNSANTSSNICPHGIAISEVAGTFSIEDIGGAAIPSATVDTFIEARNTGSATVSGTFDSCNSH